ncbi:hypothetical protein LOK49_LG01G00536 [Camellia lanceoleosa]|uniref:Uncharacterized protein n=1 Tax=Camellia lanceoleosa TaxID=1840588 RepID=A0ACC0J300_9ERIC|nr:hypothetical protein LOK49_LG01G00536 [Camellia lanceoleosa]
MRTASFKPYTIPTLTSASLSTITATSVPISSTNKSLVASGQVVLWSSESYDSKHKKYVVLYDDGDVDVLHLDKEHWELADNGHKPTKRLKSSKGPSKKGLLSEKNVYKIYNLFHVLTIKASLICLGPWNCYLSIERVEDLARLSLIQLLSTLMWMMGERSKVEGSLTSAIYLNEESPLPSTKLVRKQFGDRYAISSEEFTSEVGAKSRNIGYLKGKVPSWVGIPTSVTLPFGVFEKVFSESLNQIKGVRLFLILDIVLAQLTG